VLAVDGKTLRGSRRVTATGATETTITCEEPGRHLLAVIDQQTRVVLGQVAVAGDAAGKGSEIRAFAPLIDTLAGLDLSTVVFSADALHTQRGHVEHLRRRGAHWVLTVKGNQCATRRSGTSPPEGGTDSKGGLLGLMADLEPKGEGDQSMPGNRWPGSDAWDGVPGDPCGMTKA
jgi:hypothetical protein